MGKCIKCGKSAQFDGVLLKRTSPVGEVPADWECSPSCNKKWKSDGERIMAAVNPEQTLGEDK